jgi:hypothetical protein
MCLSDYLVRSRYAISRLDGCQCVDTGKARQQGWFSGDPKLGVLARHPSLLISATRRSRAAPDRTQGGPKSRLYRALHGAAARDR